MLFAYDDHRGLLLGDPEGCDLAIFCDYVVQAFCKVCGLTLFMDSHKECVGYLTPLR